MVAEVDEEMRRNEAAGKHLFLPRPAARPAIAPRTHPITHAQRTILIQHEAWTSQRVSANAVMHKSGQQLLPLLLGYLSLVSAR